MRTLEKLNVLLAYLQANCGDEFEACKAAGISLLFLKQWCRDDPETARQVQEAKSAGFLRIESEAIRRAVQGVEKGVYYQGEQVATETVYSDGLLTTLLKAKLPGYDKGEGGGTAIQINGGQVNIMPRASSYDEWLAMRDATAVHMALPAPELRIANDDIEEVEYEDVPFAALRGIL